MLLANWYLSISQRMLFVPVTMEREKNIPGEEERPTKSRARQQPEKRIMKPTEHDFEKC